MDRRGFMKAGMVATGLSLGAGSFEEMNLLSMNSAQAAEVPAGSKELDDVKKLPFGKIKDLKVSRMICGGNLIGGWAHSRDLIYVSELVKAYHTDKKVFETLELAEANGVNTVLTNPTSDRVINAYWKERGGEIQWISDCAAGELKQGIKRSVDKGAHAVYIQGGIADAAVSQGQVDYLGESLEYIKELGVPGGIGAHCLTTVKACVKAKIKPDFWVKTLHPDSYWTATPKDERRTGTLPPHDNMWCINPQETIDYMKGLKEPWIAFKVMAAGAIHPRDAFKFAFENGADFICAGMFDFQIIEDTMIARRVLADKELDKKRPRKWMA